MKLKAGIKLTLLAFLALLYSCSGVKYKCSGETNEKFTIKECFERFRR